MSDNVLFTIRRLRFAYNDEHVLNVEHLDIRSGRITVIVGDNGSGKTTLLKIIDGLLQAPEGTVAYAGTSGAVDYATKVRHDSVLVHQEPYLFAGAVFQNVAYGLKIRKMSRRTIHERVDEALERIGLPDFGSRRTSELSGGEKQRVAIARALVLKPKVLLLDEPTANTDRGTIQTIEALLLSLAGQGTTIIVSSHREGFAYRVCDDMVSLEDGAVVPSGVNILKGNIDSRDDHFAYFKTGGRVLRCPAQEGDFGTAAIRVDNIILSEQPIESSAQNSLAGSVTDIRPQEALFYVGLDCGFPLDVSVTDESIEKLGIQVGKELWVAFKTSAIKLY